MSLAGATSVLSWCCDRCNISCLSVSSPQTSQEGGESPGQAEPAGGDGDSPALQTPGPPRRETGAEPSSSSAGSPAEQHSRHSLECSDPRSLSGERMTSSSETV